MSPTDTEIIQAIARKNDAHEEECLKLIDERDQAEEALSQAYYLVTGRSPEWSNLFGHRECLEEIEDACSVLRQAAKAKQP